MENQRIIIASGPVIVEDGKVLLAVHGEEDIKKFCGGRVEDMTTTLIENARREAREEMGIEFEIINETPFIIHVTKTDRQGKAIDVILVHYLARRIGDITPGADIREWGWYDIQNLPDNLAPNIIPVLRHFKFID